MGKTSYYDKEESKVHLARVLRERGWEIHDFREDQSDSMADYFHPASWLGVATKDGFILCVGVSASNTSKNGGYTDRRSVPGPECEHCVGSGLEPGGWTLAAAQADPEKFNYDRCRREGSGIIPGMPGVVSPLLFNDHGQENCHVCHGAGRLRAVEDYWVDFPTFQHNPSHKNWHLEKDGKIIASGTGAYRFYHANDHMPNIKAELMAKANSFIDKIESFVAPCQPPKNGTYDMAPVEGVEIRRNEAKQGTEIVFPEKPGDDVITWLKSKKMRWHSVHQYWYAKDPDGSLAAEARQKLEVAA